MKPLAALLAILITAPAASASPPLTADEIVQVLPGRWVMQVPKELKPDPNYRCNKYAEHIWFDKGPSGEQAYHSKFERPGSETSTSPVYIDKSLFGAPLRLIRVHYIGEKRLTPEGREVEWQLIMTDRNTFYWRRTDWPPGGHTAPSIRCLDKNLVG